MDKEQRIKEMLLKASEVKTYFRDEHQDRPYVSRWTEEYAKEVACQICDALVPQGDFEGLLTKESRENCIPSDAELDAYLTTPDDAVATKLRLELDLGEFRQLGKIILYTENLIKAQRDLARQDEREK